jgi:hypothetical protein
MTEEPPAGEQPGRTVLVVFCPVCGTGQPAQIHEMEPEVTALLIWHEYARAHIDESGLAGHITERCPGSDRKVILR